MEFNANATSATNHGWRVRDTITNLFVDVPPGFADFAIPMPTEPIQTTVKMRYLGGIIIVLDAAWTYGPNVQVPGNDGENLFDTDVVLWYEGYLPHSAAEGSALWHSTGIRLVSSLVAPPPAGYHSTNRPSESERHGTNQ